MTINQEHFPTYKSLFPVLRTQTTYLRTSLREKKESLHIVPYPGSYDPGEKRG